MLLSRIKKIIYTGAAMVAVYASCCFAIELMDAIKRSDIKAIESLIVAKDQSTDIDTCATLLDENEKTPLMIAVETNQNNIVELLLAKLKDAARCINKRDKYGSTALLTASHLGHADIVDTLLTYGADPNITNQFEDTPLILASRKGYSPIVENLLKHGAHVNEQNKEGNSALILASLNGHQAVVDVLLNAQADPNITNKDGYTALIFAVANNFVTIVERLLAFKANPNCKAKEGDTALMAASTSGYDTIVAQLLAAGVQINIQNDAGNTALLLASASGRLQIVDRLLKAGADPDIQNNDGGTALTMATLNGFADIAGKLTQQSKKVINIPQKCCLLALEKNDHNDAITTGVIQAMLHKIVVVCTSHILKKLIENYVVTLFFGVGRSSLFLNKDKHTFAIIIPEAITDAVTVEKKYGYKNLEYVDPKKLIQMVNGLAETELFPVDKLLNDVGMMIDNNADTHPSRFYLLGHGQDGVIASIPIDFWAQFFALLGSVHAEFLYIHSCYAAGENVIKVQLVLKNLFETLLKRVQHETNGVKQMGQLSPPDAHHAREKFDAALVLQATADIPTSSYGNLNLFFTNLNKFLDGNEPDWTLSKSYNVVSATTMTSVDSGKDYPSYEVSMTLPTVLASLGVKKDIALPSIRMPGTHEFFRAVDIGNMYIITASSLLHKRESAFYALMQQSRSDDTSIAKKAHELLYEKPWYAIEHYFTVTPGIDYMQLYMIDLRDCVFVFPNQVPKFISKIPGQAQHFIGRIIYTSTTKDFKDGLENLINNGFGKIYTINGPALAHKCWFIKTVELIGDGYKKQVKNLIIRLFPAVNDGPYNIMYAYYDDAAGYTISGKGSVNLGMYKMAARQWFNQSLASYDAAREATGGYETSCKLGERQKLESEKKLMPTDKTTAEKAFEYFTTDLPIK